MPLADRLIVALDLFEVEAALSLALRLREYVSWFKVGSQLFLRGGPAVVAELRALGAQVFLDLKLHDIPATVGKAVEAGVQMEVGLLTVHALGGRRMLAAAAAAAAGSATRLLAVTVLTSFTEEELSEIGLPGSIGRRVCSLAALAAENGVPGIVCSARDLLFLQKAGIRPELIVTPGIRLARQEADDQRRTVSPREAFALGATHIVVGRPVLESADPVELVRNLLGEGNGPV
ncbi:Orotidine 5'-phosphate decarboxylase [Methylacidimicrobium sp. AP8]|uniref:orotidine-5'-phosphate decarboxylase n=1 Tax=Methylacidimicrobium sp. AP8 TaxID=2730359 RepID=UPI0018C11EF1|nr:orotidine-5'-phosphate decarboxylase [Methylacidimicrobium sp. AP8]CAB4244166.1 Orotidine 5'-phosphate decarboxylase [Methylacidimicrobium sp. AP8]